MRPIRAVLCLALFAAAAGALAEGEVKVSVELAQDFYYAGDPLELRVSVQNVGDAPIANPVKGDLFDGIKLSVDGASAKRKGKKEVPDGPARPETLAPQAFYGGVVDVTRIFDGLSEPGTYALHWSSAGLISERIIVRVIPRYDPGRDYSATIRTDQGEIALRFFGDRSPVAVKAFIDMAHAGYYDGLTIDEIQRDTWIVAGNPEAVVPQRTAFQFPAEISALPIVAGTVVLKPVGASPPTNGPEFIVVLKPQPEWLGQVTVLGQVVEGLDVVQKISRLPAGAGRGASRRAPATPVRIQGITVRSEARNSN